MDTGQHDLLAAACCKCTYLLQNILRIAASYPASCKRDDTVRTKLITAVLYFDIGTRPVFRAVDNQVLILFCMININFFVITPDGSSALFPALFCSKSRITETS